MSNKDRGRHSPTPKQSRRNISLKAAPSLVRAEDAPLGMYDEEGLYPHLITEVEGTRVVVPLGEPTHAFCDAYEVAPFTYQPVPPPEFERGWWFPIKRVRLLTVDRDAVKFGPPIGAIIVNYDGTLLMYCMGFRGYSRWVPVPGCHSRKKPGRVYKKWEIVVGESAQKASRVMVRYDDDLDAFEHWPDD